MTEHMEINPYAPPRAMIAEPSVPGYGGFPRISTWWVLPLTIVTFGFYPSYWLYTRIKALNEILPATVISSALPVAGMALNAANIVAALVNGSYPDMSIMPLIAAILQVAFLIVNLVCLFSLRDELENNHSPSADGWHHLSGLATLFFQVFYLNYKLNQRIDAERTGNQPHMSPTRVPT